MLSYYKRSYLPRAELTEGAELPGSEKLKKPYNPMEGTASLKSLPCHSQR
jgi:hypothetical protein